MNIRKLITLLLVLVMLPVSGISGLKAEAFAFSDINVEIHNSISKKNSFTQDNEKLTALISSKGMPAVFKGTKMNNDMTTDVAVISLNVNLIKMKSPSAVFKIELVGESGKSEFYISNSQLKIGKSEYYLPENADTSIKLLLDKRNNTYSLIIGNSVIVKGKEADFNINTDIGKVNGYAYSTSDKVYCEFVISKLELSPKEEDFKVTDISFDDGSAYIAYDSYEDYPASTAMVYTGYTWYEGTFTSSQATVIKENESNQVLRLRTLARTDVDSSTPNSAVLYGYTYFKDEKNIIGTDIYLHDTLSKIRFRLRQSPTAANYGIAHIQDGILYADGIPVMQLDMNKWYDISFILDSKDSYLSYDVYVDGKEVSKGHTVAMSKEKLLCDSSVFELYMTSSADVSSVVYLDNYKLYEGTELLEDEYFINNAPEDFFMEKETGPMTEKLKGALILAEGAPDVKLFSENSEIDKSNRDIVPYKDAGSMMVPLSYIANAYGFEVGTISDGVELRSNEKTITISGGNININGVLKPLSKELEDKNGVTYIAADDIAYAVGKKLQLTDNGLIIISDTDKFYEAPKNSFEITMLSNLLKNSKGGPRLLSEVDDEFFDDMRNKVNSGLEPYKTAWERTKANADKALVTNYPMYLLGSVNHYFNSALSAGGAMRDLAFVYRVTNEEKYAIRAKEILSEWAKAENPFPKLYMLTGNVRFKVNGLVLSRATTAFLYGYSYLYPYLDTELCRDVELWAQRIAAGVKLHLNMWLENDCFEGQYYQNHIAIDIMGITAAGIIAKDLDLLWYVIGDKSNPRKIEDLLNGCILMEGDDELCARDPTLVSGAPAVQDGEMYDRYRMRSNRGIQYAELTLRALTYTTEMLYQYGYDYYSYVGRKGENIRLPFEFYGDFFVTGDSTIKGGYYTGCIIIGRYHSMYPIANARYPESESIKNTCLNVADLAQSDGEQMGYLAALTHGEITR